MTAANRPDVLAGELPWSAGIHDLHVRIVQLRDHLLGRNGYARVDFQFERDRRKLPSVLADRPPGGGPILDAFMVDTDVAAAEILHGVKTEIGIPRATAAIDDDFSLWVETRRPEYLFDAVRRDEILGVLVTQNSRRIANADGPGNMSPGVGIGSSHVPHKGISCDSLGNVLAVHNR